jgi:DNA-binding transcriptional ArsR family regulator
MAKSSSIIKPETFEAVADLFTVLADPTRLRILYLLKQRAEYVSDLVEKSGLKQSNVSKHLAMLYDAGLVCRERNGNQIRYSVRDPLIFELCTLVCEKLGRQAESRARALLDAAG